MNQLTVCLLFGVLALPAAAADSPFEVPMQPEDAAECSDAEGGEGVCTDGLLFAVVALVVLAGAALLGEDQEQLEESPEGKRAVGGQPDINSQMVQEEYDLPAPELITSGLGTDRGTPGANGGPMPPIKDVYGNVRPPVK